MFHVYRPASVDTCTAGLLAILLAVMRITLADSPLRHGAQPLALKKIVPFLCTLTGDQNAQVSYWGGWGPWRACAGLGYCVSDRKVTGLNPWVSRVILQLGP